jgi:hypothetical protein
MAWGSREDLIFQFDSQRLHFEFKLRYYGNILIMNSSPKIIILV